MVGERHWLRVGSSARFDWGEVIAIAKYRHPGGFLAESVVIEACDAAPEGDESPWPPEPFRMPGASHDYGSMDAEHIRSLIRNAGIVGMGCRVSNGGEAVATKGQKVELLIINGAECEPFLTRSSLYAGRDRQDRPRRQNPDACLGCLKRHHRD